MMKKICLFILFFSCPLSFFAQQSVIYTHEFYKPMISNPAFTGYNEFTNAMLISRSQWIDFRNAPQLNIFTLDGMTANKKMGIGIDLFSDKKGISNKIGGNVHYSYWLRLGDETKLSFGIALGVIDHTLNYSQGVVEDPSDPFLIGTSQRETSINGNFGIGFFWKKLEVGASIPQLLGNALEYQDNISGKANYSLARHYQGSLKYKFVLSESKEISIAPMAMVHFLPSAPLQYDANLNLGWKEFWIGATYKSDHAVAANAGICISKKLYVGYSYDFIIGSIGNYSGMSHEIMLNFVFGKNKEKSQVEPEVALQSNKDQARADSLQAELEIKENKIRTDGERILELKELAEKLRKENESLKKSSAKTNDSLKNIPATVVTTENKAVEEHIRNLNEQIEKLKKENEELKKSAKTNQNAATIATTETKTIENGVLIRSASKDAYTYLNNKPALKGYYVITGAFLNLNFADDELNKLRSAGYSSSEILFSSAKQFNYVSASFHLKKEDAVEIINKIRTQGMKDAWILSVQ